VVGGFDEAVEEKCFIDGDAGGGCCAEEGEERGV